MRWISVLMIIIAGALIIAGKYYNEFITQMLGYCIAIAVSIMLLKENRKTKEF